MSVAIPALMLSMLPMSEAAAPEIPSAERYRVGEWTYCDVRLIARAWSISAEEAERILPLKIKKQGAAFVRQARDDGRNGVTPTGFTVCPYFEAGYDYNDVDALSRVWSMTIDDMKAYVENKIIWKMEEGLQDSMMHARLLAPPSPEYKMTIRVPYTICDVELTSAATGRPVTDLVRRMETEPVEKIDARLAKARKEKGGDPSLCSFYNLGFEYEHAERLAAAWGVDTSEAKVRVAAMARRGELDKVRALLQ